jgi:MFS family permease
MDAAAGTLRRAGSSYRWYVLIVLMAALAFSLLDRQILTILAGPIKKDLGLSDAELGLLYGTAFAVFYALFGVPLGRLADSWARTRLMALGLFGWSLMTVASGFAVNLTMLAVARMGVGIGEASANPAAYSLISDYFPKEKRATAIAIYTCGVSFGMGASLWFGGSIVDLWHGWFPGGLGPFGLKAWQGAFVIVGVPGLLVAALIWNLREPKRDLPRNPWPGFIAEIFGLLPPFTLLSLAALRAPLRVWATHFIVLAAIVAGAAGLITLANAVTPPAKLHILFHLGGVTVTSHALQWTAIAVGVYGIFSWTQSLSLRDAPTHALIWRSPTMVPLLIAASLQMTMAYALTAWAPLYAVTRYHLPLSTVGFRMGLIAAGVGLFGTYLGGWLADWARQYSPRGRLYVSFFGQMAPVALVPIMLKAETLEGMLGWWLIVGTAMTMWYAGTASATQDLVLPRMRGTAAATHTLCMTMIGLGLGPYLAGLVSDATGSLFTGIVSVYVVAPPLLAIFMITAIVTMPKTEARLAERAAAAGER